MSFQRTISVTELAREGEKDTRRPIVIGAEWRGVRGKAVALYFGDMEPDPRNPQQKREKWRFLPASQVTKIDDQHVSIPAWLVQSERLWEYEAENV